SLGGIGVEAWPSGRVSTPPSISEVSMSNPIDILGSDRELAAKRFESSVMKSFRMSTIFYDGGGRFGLYRNVAGVGDQVHFNMIGTTPESEYHQPGTRLEGQDQPYKRISIGVDDIVVQH